MLSSGFQAVNRASFALHLFIVRAFDGFSPPHGVWFVIMAAMCLVGGCGGAHVRQEVDPSIPSVGAPDASVVVVEFGDYQCRACCRLGRQMRVLVEERRREIRFVYRHCPSRAHPVGRVAALVAFAAQEEDRFWDLHWRFIEEGPIENVDQLWEIVSDAGFEPQHLRDIIASGRPEEALARDIARADALGIRGIPTTYINDQMIEGTVSLERLRVITADQLGHR